MLNKKVKAILFMFLILFCISAVNAESIDNNTDAQSVDIINVESEDYVAIIAETSTAGNFSDLNKTINGNKNTTITLDKNYTYDKDKDTAFQKGIVINRTLTIDGKGFTIDGSSSARIFNITNGSLTVKNINFINGGLFNGSAIYNDGGKLTIVNSTFKDNCLLTFASSRVYTVRVNGGAIYSKNDIDIVNSTFTNNSAIKSTMNSRSYYMYVRGGAVYCEKNVIVNNSKFNNNSQIIGGYQYNSFSVYGGAIYSNNITIVDSSSFENNSVNKAYGSSSFYGGAIYSINSINVTNSNFTNNSNCYYQTSSMNYANGGAIYSGNYTNIINSNFNYNALSKVFGSGGATYSSNNVTIVNSTFNKNLGVSVYSKESLFASNSTFTNNSLSGYGVGISGAIFANDDLIITSCNFTKNTGTDGGAIGTTNGFIKVVDSIFTENNGVNGGAIFGTNNTVVINSIFTGNHATIDGGAIYGTNNLTVSDCNFTNNTVVYNGGAISNNQGSATVTNSIFENNTGKLGGAINSHNLTITNSEFFKNTGVYGGAIYTSAYLNATDIDLTNNSADYGGAVYISASLFGTSSSDIANCNFTNNKANNGGAIYVAIGNVTIDKSKFINNTSVKGGAICYTNFYTDNQAFLNSSYPYDDFKEFMDNSLTVKNSEFDNNAGSYGDDIYSSWNTTVAGNSYTKNSYANIYANNTIINHTIVSVLQNKTYYLNLEEKFGLNATVTADGASVAGYNLIITDGENKYNATYVGYGIYKTDDVTDEFIIKHYSAIINNKTDDVNYNVENGTIISHVINLEVVNLTKYYGNDEKFVILLADSNGSPLANRNVTITINGVTYTRMTDSEGKIMMSINLDAGVYEATVSYGNFTQNATITILPTIEADDLVKYFKNGSQYYAKFLDVNGNPLANTNVTFNIHGVFYTRATDENGIAKLNINLNPGEYIITAYNPTNNESKSNVITVLTTIIGNNVVKFYRNGTQYYAYVLDLDGTPLANTNVTFNIHGVFYTRQTNEEGIVKLNINLNPGEYIITAWNPVNNESYSNNITVLNVVESSNLEMTTSARKPFKVTILGDHGEPLPNAEVTFNIHGVFYHKTTDANGQVSLDINLISGRYIITTYYNDYSVSNIILIK